jgi:hypothetical protein
MGTLNAFWPVNGVPESQAQWTLLTRVFHTDGIIPTSRGGLSGQFNVTQRGAGANMPVDVQPGDCVLAGIAGELGSTDNNVIGNNNGGTTRLDYVVARVEFGVPDVILTVLPGDGSGNAPALTNNATFWDVAIAQVNVAPAAASITNANITDLRTADKYVNT